MSQPNFPVDVVVVGGGLMGAVVARLVRQSTPSARILMVDAGPAIGTAPGVHLHDSPDPEVWAKYNTKVATGVQTLYLGSAPTPPLDVPAAEATPGMYNASSFGADAAEFPYASIGWNAGGMSVHWTAACPWPADIEAFDFGDPDQWESDLALAQDLLRVNDSAFELSVSGEAVLRTLGAEFGEAATPGRSVQRMPMAMQEGDGLLTRTGPAVVFPPIANGGDDRFEIRVATICTAILHDGRTATGVRLRDIHTGEESEVSARSVVVAADAIRSPQLLFASGIRPPALGTHLNDHAFLTGRVFPDPEKIGFDPAKLRGPRRGEWATGAYWLPRDGSRQPFHGQLMERAHIDAEGRVLALSVGLAWNVITEIRAENRVEFSESELDATGMPRMRMHFSYSDADLAAIEAARASQKRAGDALGNFDAEKESALMPPGASLHYTGTVRVGAVDDGSSVADSHGRVWTHDNVFVAGNGAVPTALAANATLTGVITAVMAARGVAASLAD